jgi:hypothetical protein
MFDSLINKSNYKFKSLKYLSGYEALLISIHSAYLYCLVTGNKLLIILQPSVVIMATRYEVAIKILITIAGIWRLCYIRCNAMGQAR